MAPCPPHTPPSPPFEFFPEPGPLATALEDPKKTQGIGGGGAGEGVRAHRPLAPSPAHFVMPSGKTFFPRQKAPLKIVLTTQS